jgi:hypothetical protein
LQQNAVKCRGQSRKSHAGIYGKTLSESFNVQLIQKNAKKASEGAGDQISEMNSKNELALTTSD